MSEHGVEIPPRAYLIEEGNRYIASMASRKDMARMSKLYCADQLEEMEAVARVMMTDVDELPYRTLVVTLMQVEKLDQASRRALRGESGLDQELFRI